MKRSGVSPAARTVKSVHCDLRLMRALPWLAGVVAAAGVAAAAQTVVGVDLAALTGIAWGVVAWTFVGYPEARAITYEGLEGRHRWLVAMSLVPATVAFATVRIFADGATATVLYAQVLAVSAALLTVGALLEAHT